MDCNCAGQCKTGQRKYSAEMLSLRTKIADEMNTLSANPAGCAMYSCYKKLLELIDEVVPNDHCECAHQ
jgi:hypothetical protein